MARFGGLSSWQTTVSSPMGHLSQPQLTGLVYGSIGIMLAQRCGLRSVAAVLALFLRCREDSIRARLRAWYRDATDNRGARRGEKRQSLDVTTCFAPLLRWVISRFPPTCRQLALAMDASTLGQRFTVLSIHVVISGCAIPVAWTIVEATRPGAWKPLWQALVAALEGSVPTDWTVIVLADRGLYATWLFETIVGMGWHPMLRINRQGKFRRAGHTAFEPLSTVVRKGSDGWAGAGTCFATKDRQLPCTLLAQWGQM